MQNLFNRVYLRFEFHVKQSNQSTKLSNYFFIWAPFFEAVYFLQIFVSSYQSFSKKYTTKLNSIFFISGQSCTKVWMRNLEFKSWNLSTIQLLIPVKSFFYYSFYSFRTFCSGSMQNVWLIQNVNWFTVDIEVFPVSTFEFLMRLEKNIRHWFEK